MPNFLNQARLKTLSPSLPGRRAEGRFFFSPPFFFLFFCARANKRKASFTIHNSVFSGYAGRRGAAQSEYVYRSCRCEQCNPQQQSQPPAGESPGKTDSGRYLPYQGGRRRAGDGKSCRAALRRFPDVEVMIHYTNFSSCSHITAA